MIGLLGDGNVFYVSPAHSEILILLMGNTYLGECALSKYLKLARVAGDFGFVKHPNKDICYLRRIK